MRWLWTLLLAGTLIACSHEPPPYESRYTEPVDEKPIAVAVLGDSFTTGTEYGGLDAMGWPSIATLKLRDQGINIAVANGAERGAGWSAPNSAGMVFLGEVARHVSQATRLVVVFGSLNDGSISRDVLSPSVAKTLTAIRQAAPQARLLVVGPPTLGRNDQQTPGKMLAVRDSIRDEALRAGATFADPLAENWFDNPEFIGRDGIHPSDAGHEMMASKIAPLIDAQLRSTPPQP